MVHLNQSLSLHCLNDSSAIEPRFCTLSPHVISLVAQLFIPVDRSYMVVLLRLAKSMDVKTIQNDQPARMPRLVKVSFST